MAGQSRPIVDIHLADCTVIAMQNALTVTRARSKLGHLVDQAAKGKPVYLRRHKDLLRLARVK